MALQEAGKLEYPLHVLETSKKFQNALLGKTESLNTRGEIRFLSELSGKDEKLKGNSGSNILISGQKWDLRSQALTSPWAVSGLLATLRATGSTEFFKGPWEMICSSSGSLVIFDSFFPERGPEIACVCLFIQIFLALASDLKGLDSIFLCVH